MKRIIQTACVASTFATGAFALEFGMMGSHAFGMAGTGVAVKFSPWGLYYNPSLIATDNALKMGLYFDGHSKNIGVLNSITKRRDEVTLNDLYELHKFLQDSRVSFGSHSGIVFQLPDFGVGFFSFGSFLHLFGSGSVKIDPLPNPPVRPPVSFDQLGLSAKFSIFSLVESPLAYAYDFETSLGYISVGATMKYMKLFGSSLDFKLKDGADFNPMKEVSNMQFEQGSSNVGVDVGIAYEPNPFFTFGLVGKNLNAPVFNFGTSKITIDPQIRAGAAFDTGLFTLAFDADLTKNQILGSDLKSQMVSLGAMLDFRIVAFRAGLAKDLQHENDLIYAFGLGVAIFDIGVQFGKKTNPLSGADTLDYFALQAGLGFSF